MVDGKEETFISGESKGDVVLTETSSSKSSKIPKAKKSVKVNLGKDGIFELEKGKPIPAGVDKRFYGSLEVEKII